MTTVAAIYSESLVDDDRPGAFRFWTEREGGETAGLHFRCPRCGRIGSVRFAPGKWAWDRDRERPTVTPSIAHNCGWHGFLRRGVFRET